MFNQKVRKVMEGERILVASLQTPVSRAAQLMAEGGVGVVLVVDGDQLVGSSPRATPCSASSRAGWTRPQPQSKA